MPHVSVITAFYNPGAFLAETIESVLAQTYSDWEIWLVNDGSTDGSEGVGRAMERNHPGRVHYLEHPDGQNHGACSSRNLALQRAQGSLVAILDADDVWLPQKLTEQVKLAELHPECGLIYGRSEYWQDWPGNPKPAANFIPEIAPGERIYPPTELLRVNFPLGPKGAPCPSDTLIRTDVLRSIGGFETRFDRHQAYEDQILLAKLYLNTSTYVSSHCWDRYRLHQDSCCSVAERTGSIGDARRLYLEWLEQYLKEKGVEDPEIWNALRKETLGSKHPLLFAPMRFARRLSRRLGLS